MTNQEYDEFYEHILSPILDEAYRNFLLRYNKSKIEEFFKEMIESDLGCVIESVSYSYNEETKIADIFLRAEKASEYIEINFTI